MHLFTKTMACMTLEKNISKIEDSLKYAVFNKRITQLNCTAYNCAIPLALITIA